MEKILDGADQETVQYLFDHIIQVGWLQWTEANIIPTLRNLLSKGADVNHSIESTADYGGRSTSNSRSEQSTPLNSICDNYLEWSQPLGYEQ
jgi:hypothetical protein